MSKPNPVASNGGQDVFVSSKFRQARLRLDTPVVITGVGSAGFLFVGNARLEDLSEIGCRLETRMAPEGINGQDKVGDVHLNVVKPSVPREKNERMEESQSILACQNFSSGPSSCKMKAETEEGNISNLRFPPESSSPRRHPAEYDCPESAPGGALVPILEIARRTSPRRTKSES